MGDSKGRRVEWWVGGVPRRVVPLGYGVAIRIGRAPGRNDVVVHHPAMAERQATVRLDTRLRPVVEDLSPRGTTRVDGQILSSPCSLTEGMVVTFEGVPDLELRFHDVAIPSTEHLPASGPLSITSSKLGRTVTTAKGPRVLLSEVDLNIQAGELVAILGASGAGKSTLLHALSGAAPIQSGSITIQGQDLTSAFDRIQPHLAVVPQDDIVHLDLTIRQALNHAATLRLPPALRSLQRVHRVEEVLDLVELAQHSDTIVGMLSGGQRKRVSIAMELLAPSGLMFLDEPTSGLDPATRSRLVHLFRRIADGGCTVLVTTHLLGELDLFDRTLVLSEGKLVFDGPPQSLLPAFGAQSALQVYVALEQGQGPEVHEESSQPNSPDTREGAFPENRPKVPGLLRQCSALVSRQGDRILARGGLSLLSLALQPLLVSLLLLAVAGPTPNAPRTWFLATVAALWFGVSLTVREVIDEAAIYGRERGAGLSPLAYLSAKVIAFGLTCGAQIAILLAVLMAGGAVRHHLVESLSILMLTGLNGVALGLTLSSLARSATGAMSFLPLLLIVQVLLAGLLIPVADLPPVIPVSFQEIVAADRTEGRRLQAIKDALGDTLSEGFGASELGPEAASTLARVVPRAASSPAVGVLSTPVATRWAMEALAHLFIHDPFDPDLKGSNQLYPYLFFNSVDLSLYTEAQRKPLRDRLIAGQSEQTEAVPAILGLYLLRLAILALLPLLLAWMRLSRVR